ncbi:SymE family type I addiction module toxin [Serratia fonticola]
MNGTHSIQATTGGYIPKLIIDGEDITNAGFVAGVTFKIDPYQDGLIISLISNEGEIERLLLEVDTHPNIGADWVRDNGDLYLAGDWLTQYGLSGQQLTINAMPGKVVIQVQQSDMLA